MGGWVYIEFWRGLIYKPKIEIISPQQSQIHKIRLILSSSALPWFHTGRVRISVVWLISLHHLHWLPHLGEGWYGGGCEGLPLPPLPPQMHPWPGDCAFWVSVCSLMSKCDSPWATHVYNHEGNILCTSSTL